MLGNYQVAALVPSPVVLQFHRASYKYGYLAFKVGRVSDETANYGDGFCATLATE
jgi:hypothetical protein